MIQKSDGMTYAPKGKIKPVCEENEFKFAVIGLSHGHIYGMCNGLIEAGATLVSVYDRDINKINEFISKFPKAIAARSEEEILENDEIKLIAAAAVPSERSELGIRVMEAKKDYFTDKTPFTTLEQLHKVKKKVKETNMKYYVYFSERLHFEDFGHAMLQGKNGSTNYFRVDWFTPDGLRTWGDGRTIILGTKGFIEIRKYIDLAGENCGDHVFLVNEKGEQKFSVAGKVGYPFFGEFILDCINRTENSMTQAHVFKAAELCLEAQKKAIRIN